MSWSDVDFAAKRIDLRRQSYFLTPPKTESKLNKSQTNGISATVNVYVHREADGHIERKSKSLPAPVGEKCRMSARSLEHAEYFYTHNALKLQEETAAVFDKDLQTK